MRAPEAAEGERRKPFRRVALLALAVLILGMVASVALPWFEWHRLRNDPAASYPQETLPLIKGRVGGLHFGACFSVGNDHGGDNSYGDITDFDGYYSYGSGTPAPGGITTPASFHALRLVRYGGSALSLTVEIGGHEFHLLLPVPRPGDWE